MIQFYRRRCLCQFLSFLLILTTLSPIFTNFIPIAYAEEPGSLSDAAMIHEVNFEGIDLGSCNSQIDDDSYYICIPYDTDVSNLKPIISISDGASITPASGVSQDFSSPVTYTLTAEAGNTRTWKVICIKEDDIQYKVEHYQQNKEGSGYTLFETDELNAEPGAVVEACSKSYTGFFENTMHGDRIASGKVEAEGFVMKLYYDREQYSISFEESGGDGSC